MALVVDINCESRYKCSRARIRQTIERVLGDRGVRGEAEVRIAVVGERKMADLHKKYQNLDGPTDVLSFPLEGSEYPDGVLRLGDIVVCYPVAVAQAREKNKLVDDEIAGLVEHGCLHLLGIHHAEA